MIKTNGIVLRSMKYRETSLIVDIFTRDFGMRSYIVNGVRKTSAKKSASSLQVTNFLEILAYDNKDADKLNRLKEFKLSKYHDGIYSNPIKSMIAQFMIEVLRKCVKDYYEHIELYEFMEQWFFFLNNAKQSLANFLLVYMVRLAELMGIGFSNDSSLQCAFFDLKEGEFTNALPIHPYYIEGTQSDYLKLIISTQKEEMHQFNVSSVIRSQLLDELIIFYRLHIESFGELKTLDILRTIMR